MKKILSQNKKVPILQIILISYIDSIKVNRTAVIIGIGIGVAIAIKWLAENPPDISTPDPTPPDDCDDRKKHRGRIQAQGGGVEKSVSWAQNTPLTLSQGRTLLANLVSQLTPFEKEQRTTAIIRASKWMTNASAGGGVGPTSVSFYEIDSTRKLNMIKDASTRIDIEVNEGLAFVP